MYSVITGMRIGWSRCGGTQYLKRQLELGVWHLEDKIETRYDRNFQETTMMNLPKAPSDREHGD